MYRFIDTTETQPGRILPAEALSINGQYIEDVISGYRTLNVSGRELLESEIDDIRTESMDGSWYREKHYPPRFIIVTYQLSAASPAEFRKAFNELNALLDVENAQLIFNDEPDKFFIGTKASNSDVPPGTNHVTGEIEFYCSNPFKYSVVEYEATVNTEDKSLILVDYKGTYRAFPVLESRFYTEEDVSGDGETENSLTGNGDCGFVAFFNDNEKIIQLGNPNEIDGTNDLPKSQTLVNQSFLTTYGWEYGARKPWSVNSDVTLPYNIDQVGTVHMRKSGEDVVWDITRRSAPSKRSKALLAIKSESNNPVITYTVSAREIDRTDTTADIAIVITAALAETSDYLKPESGIAVSVYIGGVWHDAIIKNTDECWTGDRVLSANLNVTVSELTAETTEIAGIKFRAYRIDENDVAGAINETTCNNMIISSLLSKTIIDEADYYLTPSDYGEGILYHGPSITRYIPEDESGETGATDFTFTYKQKLCMDSADTKQMGGFQMCLLSEDDVCIAGVRIQKNTYVKTGTLFFYVNNEKVATKSIDLSYLNQFFGADKESVQTSVITKSGNTVNFNVGGSRLYVKRDNISELKVTKIAFTFEQYSNLTPFSYNGLYYAKFVKNNCDTWNDIPNKFSANDVLEADCNTGQIYLNGIETPGLGAIANDWEEFYLVPGVNQIGVAYSDWITDEFAPEFKIRYREVYI